MAKSLDRLIDFLLEEIALSGEQGVTLREVVGYADAFYSEPNPAASATSTGTNAHPSLFNRRFVAKLWQWLARHEDIIVADDNSLKQASLDQIEALFPGVLGFVPETSSLSPQTLPQNTIHAVPDPSHVVEQQAVIDEPRIKVTTERVWYAICGHEADLNRVPSSEWVLLCAIAATRHEGILQGELGRSVGQDKRSVPKRTDALQEKGYVVKRTAWIGGHKTSRLILRRFADSFGSSSLTDRAVYTLQDLAVQVFPALKNNVFTTQDDLAETLCMTDPARKRVLGQVVRHCVQKRLLKKVRVATGPSSRSADLKVCLQVLRDPIQTDWNSRDDDIIDRNTSVDDAVAAARIDISEESADTIDVFQEDDVDDNNNSGSGPSSVTTSRSIRPQWNPDRLLPNVLLDCANNAGEEGITNVTTRQAITGLSVRRPVESLLVRLSHASLKAQPLAVRDRALVRTTELRAGATPFVHRSLAAYASMVQKNEAAWASLVGGKELAKQLETADANQPMIGLKTDEYGFASRQKPVGQIHSGQVSQEEVVQMTTAVDLSVRALEPTIVETSSAGGTPSVRIETRLGAGQVSHSATPRKKSTVRKPPGNGRPRKFTQGTEKFWREMFLARKLQEEQDYPKSGAAGLMGDPVCIEMYNSRPSGLDEMVVKALNHGLPLPTTPQGVSQDWIDKMNTYFQRQMPGLYLIPSGMKNLRRNERSCIVVIRTARLKEIDFGDRRQPASVQFLSSSVAHTTRHGRLDQWAQQEKSKNIAQPVLYASKPGSIAAPALPSELESMELAAPEGKASQRGNIERDVITKIPRTKIVKLKYRKATPTQSTSRNADINGDITASASTLPDTCVRSSVKDFAALQEARVPSVITTGQEPIVQTPAKSKKGGRARKPSQKALESARALADEKNSTLAAVSNHNIELSGISLQADIRQADTQDDSQGALATTNDARVQEPEALRASPATIRNSIYPATGNLRDMSGVPLVVTSVENLPGEHSHLRQSSPSFLLSNGETCAAVSPERTNSNHEGAQDINGGCSKTKDRVSNDSDFEPARGPVITGTSSAVRLNDLHDSRQGSGNHQQWYSMSQTEARPQSKRCTTDEPAMVGDDGCVSGAAEVNINASAEPIQPVQVDRITAVTASEEISDAIQQQIIGTIPTDTSPFDGPSTAAVNIADATATKRKPNLAAPRVRGPRYLKGRDAVAFYKKTIMELVYMCGGVVPHSASLLKRAMKAKCLEANVDYDPNVKLIKSQISALLNQDKLKVMQFAFQRNGFNYTKSILALPHTQVLDGQFLALQRHISSLPPEEDFVPPELDAEAERQPSDIIRRDSSPETDTQPSAATTPKRQRKKQLQPRARAESSIDLPARRLSFSPAASELSLNVGFLTLKVRRIGEVQTQNAFTTNYFELPAQPLQFTTDANAIASHTADPTPSSQRRSGVRIPRNTKFNALTRKIQWRVPKTTPLPKSLKTILSQDCGITRADAEIEDDAAMLAFIQCVESVSSWEQRSYDDLQEPTPGQWNFINHLMSKKEFPGLRRDGELQFRLIRYIGASTRAFDQVELETELPEAESWDVFEQILTTTKTKQKRVAAATEKRKRRLEELDGKDADPEDSDFGVPDHDGPKRKRIRRQSASTKNPKKRKAGTEGDKRRLKRTKHEPRGIGMRHLPQDQAHRLGIIFAVVKVLAGGLDRYLDFKLVNRLVPEESEVLLRERWKVLSTRYNNDVDALVQNLQIKYLDALADDKVPTVNYDNLEGTNWEGILDWALVSINTENKDLFREIPPTREELLALNKVEVAEATAVRNLFNNSLNFTQTSKEEAWCSAVFGTSLSGQVLDDVDRIGPRFPAEEAEADLEQARARSWALAAVLTPQQTFDSVYTHQQLLKLANNERALEDLLDTTMKMLQSDKVIIRKDGGDPITTTDGSILAGTHGWRIAPRFFDRFNTNRLITPTMLRDAVKYKIDVLDAAFAQGEVVPLEKELNLEDGCMMAIFNLVSMGMLIIKPGSDVPASRYGLDWENQEYKTRSMDKNILSFTTILEATQSYVYGDPTSTLRHRTSIPRNETGQQKELELIPVWFDLNHHFRPDIWEMVVGAIIGMVSVRPGLPIIELVRSFGWTLPQREIEMVLQFLQKCLLVEKICNGWETTEWWWSALGTGYSNGTYWQV